MRASVFAVLYGAGLGYAAKRIRKFKNKRNVERELLFLVLQNKSKVLGVSRSPYIALSVDKALNSILAHYTVSLEMACAKASSVCNLKIRRLSV